jgi:tetratricopeptide (TPR) repeat protein
MAKRPFSTRPSYVQYIQALRRLHELIAADQDDTPEGDAVRDGMDGPWYELSEAEQNRINGLSEDLYSISDPPEDPRPMDPQVQRKWAEANAARHAGEWDKSLEILRRWKRHFDPALLSYLRGTVWQDAGDSATASLFFQHASSLEPGNEAYTSAYLHALGECNPEAALACAKEILSFDVDHPPFVVVEAARIRYKSARRMAKADALPFLRELTPILERTLERLQSDEARESLTFEATYVNICSLLGYCYEDLGDSQAALRYYNLALAADPNDIALLVSRGILRYDRDPAAVSDFEQAIRIGYPFVWPYFYLAHHYLVNNRFDDCRRMCERALEFPATSNEIRGDLNEWRAISMAEQGFPAGQVRSAFEEAVRLAPDSERIRQNFEVFERASTLHNWVKPRESQVKALGPSGYLPTAA